MLNAAFKDTAEITAYGKDRLLNYGVDDVYYKRWFGKWQEKLRDSNPEFLKMKEIVTQQQSWCRK